MEIAALKKQLNPRWSSIFSSSKVLCTDTIPINTLVSVCPRMSFIICENYKGVSRRVYWWNDFQFYFRVLHVDSFCALLWSCKKEVFPSLTKPSLKASKNLHLMCAAIDSISLIPWENWVPSMEPTGLLQHSLLCKSGRKKPQRWLSTKLKIFFSRKRNPTFLLTDVKIL